MRQQPRRASIICTQELGLQARDLARAGVVEDTIRMKTYRESELQQQVTELTERSRLRSRKCCEPLPAPRTILQPIFHSIVVNATRLCRAVLGDTLFCGEWHSHHRISFARANSFSWNKHSTPNARLYVKELYLTGNFWRQQRRGSRRKPAGALRAGKELMIGATRQLIEHAMKAENQEFSSLLRSADARRR
jgi:enoyl-CoA hydratase/carnithine racemase